MKPFYYKTLLKLTDFFIACKHKLDHPWFLKAFRNYTFHEFKAMYGHMPDYESMFNKFWNAASPRSNQRIQLVKFMLHLNFAFMNNITLRTICGIQPMTGPVGLAKRLNQVVDGTLKDLEAPVQAGARKYHNRVTLELVEDYMNEDDDIYGSGIIDAMVVEFDLEYVKEFRGKVDQFAPRYDLKVATDFTDYEAITQSGKSLVSMINKMADDIKARTGSRGNVVWLSPAELTLIQVAGADTGYVQKSMVAESDIDSSTPTVGNAVSCGKLVDDVNPPINVYCVIDYDRKNNDFPDIIVGYKKDDYDASMVLLPYIPVLSVGPVMDPDTCEPILSFLTRYTWWDCQELTLDADGRSVNKDPDLSGYGVLSLEVTSDEQ